ncbi:MAG: CDP-glycerol glycerophosphotransferase family protein, partial [Erysipelotrichales bacterium]
MKLILIRVSATLRNTYYYIIGFIAGLFTKPSKKYIMFSSFSGDKFNDSPKAIFDYLVNEDYILVYSFKNKIDIENFNKEYPQHIAVKYNSFKHYFYLKKAKTWIFNFKTPPYFIKDKDTTFIQTWHGIPLKRLGCDIINENQRFYRSKQTYQQMVQSYIDEGKKADYFIGVSPYCKDKLKSAFKLNDNQFIDIGYPRNYKLYQDNNIELIKQELGIEQSKKVILYAPTWRDDSMNLHGFTSDFILDLDNLVKELGEDYIVLYRPHYLIKNDINFNNKNIINVAAYQDLTALFLISDLLITDYSSLYFDYA